MSRCLVVDGQVFQTPALFRGMGKYSVELLQALIAEQGKTWDSIEVVLSEHFTIEPDEMAELKDKLPDAEFVSLDIKRNIIGDRSIPVHNREVIDEYLSSRTGTIDYLVLSLMQGEIQPVFPSSKTVRKMVLFYDLIPLMLHKTYLGNPITREEYLSKLKELLMADLYLAISKTVANDLSNYLGVDRSRVVSIDGGPIAHGQKEKKVDVKKPFILMPTGNDLRKNNTRGIQGFEAFNRKHDNKYSLVITSFFKDHEITHLKTLSDNLIFTGNIGGDEMHYLYRHCDALLFPSEYEGLGLPILEAVEANKPIACSDISVFREMSMVDFDVFDPKSPAAIEAALEGALGSRKIVQSNYKAILKKYTWKNTAKAFISSIDSIVSDESLQKTSINFVTPDLSRTEPLMRFNLLAYAEMSRNFAITYCGLESGSKREMRINYLPYVTSQKGVFDLNDDLVVYSVDDSKSYARVLPIALARPGLLMLHDTDLNKLWAAAKKDKVISGKRFQLEKMIDERYGVEGAKCIVSLVIKQKAVVVFNKKAQKTVKTILKNAGRDNVPVYVSSLATATMRYPDILPQKTIETGFVASEDYDRSDAARSATVLNDVMDFDFIEHVSQVKRLLCSENNYGAGSKNVLAFEAAARDVEPVIDDSDAYVSAAEIEKHGPLSFAEKHSYRKFAQELANIINEVQ